VKKFHPVAYYPKDTELQDLLLQELEDIFFKNGINMYNYNLPHKNMQYKLDINNNLIQEELNYDRNKLEEEANILYRQLIMTKEMPSTK